MPEIKPNEVERAASIKVIGVGGAGGAAINRMREAGFSGVELIAMNTDAQALCNSKADVKVHLGSSGLGAGADPMVGERAAEESRDEIRDAVAGADMVFVTFGAGGGTGSGASYIVAEEARKQGILVVGVVTKPFSFERKTRQENAKWAIDHFSRSVDALITISNDRLLDSVEQIPLLESFKIADEVLQQGVQGISELITEYSLINLDFADVKAIMKDAGSALMGIGRASGENRAAIAAQLAIDSPLIDVSIDGARGVLFQVAGGSSITMAEMQEAADVITEKISPEANVIWGASIRPELEDEVIVTVVATGFDSGYFNDDMTSARGIYSTPEPELKAEINEEVAEPSIDEVKEEKSDIDLDIENHNSDFTEATTTNMWDSIRTENSSDDSDLPAILRRRKKNKD